MRHETRAADAPQRFLLALSDALRPLADADEIQSEAARLLGEQLGANRVVYVEVDDGGDTIGVLRHHASGVPPLAGRYRLDDYDPGLLRALRLGRTVARADIAADDRLTAHERAAHAQLQLGATVHVPLLKDGRLVALLAVHRRGAHQWLPAELELIESVAERTWDAVERARAQQAQRRAVAQYERQARLFDGVASTTPDFVYMFDREGHFQYANRRLLEVWGMALPDIVGKTCRELGYEQWHHDMHMREIAQVIATRHPIKGEVPFKAPLTGVFGVYEYIFTPVLGPDGEVEAIAGTTRDVTERKLGEDDVRRRSEQFQSLLEGAPIGMFLVNADLRLVQVNPAALRALGAYDGPLHGRGLEEVLMRVWGQAFAAALIEMFRHTLNTGEPFHEPEGAGTRVDTGARAYYDWRIQRIRQPDGTLGVLCYFTDITDRKRAEAALREADRRKDEFLATLAHELRNPLAPVRAAVQILNRKGPNDPQLQAARDIIERQVSYMVRLIDDLLEVSRITLGKLELRRERTTLHQVLDVAVEIARPHLQQELQVMLPPQPVELDADPTRLAQVFGNLLTNACRYTPAGGHIAVEARVEDGELVVRVRDDGIGIAPEHLPRLFQMFSQVESAGSRAQGGLGIGLALAKGIVELHGGRVAAHSEGAGRGTEFTVRLPIAATPAAAAPPAPHERAHPALAGRRILVVDDNEDSALTLATLLELEGAQVQAAHDGEQAVALAQQLGPELILLDIGLPRMNGYEACRAIRAQAGVPRPAIVALTGWGQQEDRRKTAEAGFDGHLVKPVDHAQLLRMIDELLRR
jgi:PAS domain S-box-containing protein